MTINITPDALTRFGRELFKASGMDNDKADTSARLLVLGDMMGRQTHGMALAPLYLDQLERRLMQPTGEPVCVKDTGSTILWEGNYLPGLWLVDQALQLAFGRIREHGVVTIVIRRSHHIACLAALIKQATDRGYLAILANSDPSGRFVAPYGGKEPLMTPNPFAIGYPGTKTPVLVDICASITTVSMTRKKVAEGRNFEYPWLLDAAGAPTTDPTVLEGPGPRGSILLLGGTECGHKGFGLALMVEALTQGLSGCGRRRPENRWGGNVFLQVLDPDAFSGRADFIEQMDFLTDSSHENAPIRQDEPVRMPGEQAERNISKAHINGIALTRHTIDALGIWARKLAISLPDALTTHGR